MLNSLIYYAIAIGPAIGTLIAYKRSDGGKGWEQNWLVYALVYTALMAGIRTHHDLDKQDKVNALYQKMDRDFADQGEPNALERELLPLECYYYG